MNEFKIKLGETYFNDGILNVSVKFSEYFGEHNSYIKVNLGEDLFVFGKIDRNANETSSPRIRFEKEFHKTYVTWLNNNFVLNDFITISHDTKYEIKISKN